METSARVESVEDAAAQWLLRRESAAWSERDEAALEQWLSADTGHWVAYTRLKSVWRDAGRMKLLQPASGGVPPVRGALTASPFLSRRFANAESEPQIATRRAWLRRSSIAAGVLLAAAVAAGVYVTGTQAPSYRTAVGGLTTVPMDDGSAITLNTNSEVRVAATARERKVTLVRGEAYFDVRQDARRPFIVEAAGERVVVLGTQFSVHVREEGTRIRIAEGRVRVEEVSWFGAGRSLAELRAGHMAEVREGRIRVEEVPLVDLEQSLSWRAGYIALEGTPLGDAVAEFNRYNHRQLVITDPTLAGVRVGGYFKWDNLDGFLRMLQEGFGIRAQPRGATVLLTREAL